MALTKYSTFFYGHTINKQNRALNFLEPSGLNIELTGSIAIGSFTLTEFGAKVVTAINAISSQEYTITLDRTTRKFTISAPANFDLLVGTGVNKTISVFTLLGFTGSDLTGSNTYTSNVASGSAYITQSPLANFSDFKHNKEKSEAVVKTTPGGVTEVISYAVLERMKCDFPIITNYVPQRRIRETATGIEEVESFLDYIIEKAPIEFMEDYTLPLNYTSCILDKTRASSKGVGYSLVERVGDTLPGYYKQNGLVFLKIEVDNG